MKQVADLPTAAEQIRALKEAVTAAKYQNKIMVTRKNKAKVQTEKTLKDIDNAKNAPKNPRPEPQPIQKDNDLTEEFRTLVNTGSRVKGIPQKPGKTGLNKKANMFDTGSTFCGCGAQNPEHKGYCLNCVAKLKDKFTELLGKLETSKADYDDFNDDKKA